jgi:hypothetical protein
MNPEARTILVDYYRERRTEISKQLAELNRQYTEYLDIELELPRQELN